MNFGLQNKINSRIKRLKYDGIQYVSGTVAPAESDHDTNDIESLPKALTYFVDKGVETVHIQPKWMGSRCQLYMFKDEPEKNFAVSRNGFKIRGVDLSQVFNDYSFMFDQIRNVDHNKEIKSFILDGELIPWNAIGAGLIEREFSGFMEAASSELEFLETNGLNEIRSKVGDSDEYSEFTADVASGLSKKELQKKYPRYETYANFSAITSYDFEQEHSDLSAYDAQLKLYGATKSIEFKAFDILRVEYADGTFNVDDDWMKNTYMKYLLVNLYNRVPEERYGLVVPPTAVNSIREYMDTLVGNGYEGIMIKPVFPGETDAVHCMKVRNKEYLRIIYGYDYQRPEKLTELVRKKRVGKKRKLSHHEYFLGKKMLKLDWNSVDFDEQYDTITKDLLFQIEEEATLDNRL